MGEPFLAGLHKKFYNSRKMITCKQVLSSLAIFITTPTPVPKQNIMKN